MVKDAIDWDPKYMATSRLLSGALLRLKFHIPLSLIRLQFQAYATYTTFGCTFRIESHSINSSCATSGQKKSPSVFSNIRLPKPKNAVQSKQHCGHGSFGLSLNIFPRAGNMKNCRCVAYFLWWANKEAALAASTRGGPIAHVAVVVYPLEHRRLIEGAIKKRGAD